MIEELRSDHLLAILCRVLDVSRSGYQAWRVRRPSRRVSARERLRMAICAAHRRTRGTYGAVRLQKELAADGFAVSLGTTEACAARTRLAVHTTKATLSRDDDRLAAQLAGRP